MMNIAQIRHKLQYEKEHVLCNADGDAPPILSVNLSLDEFQTLIDALSYVEGQMHDAARLLQSALPEASAPEAEVTNTQK